MSTLKLEIPNSLPRPLGRNLGDSSRDKESSPNGLVESKWISLAEELRIELEASRSLAEKQKQELDAEKQCTEELKEAMQMAMEGHARMLEQAGVRGAESKFINALAAEISALKAEREKEKRFLRDENKGLQAQLRDTAEALQAAGEVLVRLKEAEEAVAAAQVCLLFC
ncbi:hypothetical protein Pint_22623 [Pistacia integerrima]|uniref:Uncharacterized protein n=1 Tax=Pistacia integerrima TaxID=434235 RepID=A0ACC0YJP6_9ROSI|nr:hypothetical protein Pint_22623 [Pistacia integerrima]